ncbi:MAG: hypothetical protein N4A48_08610 [Tepidibacter sp.]|jgi:chromosome segregation ATPase|uniref:hypothetical protein n=1 Tax=Tepidibacter sp. TaxID=2529387 RepID=UPI0025F7713E|nr:hypothetical protein [Tepidibacter sp.]MCT4508808.1 hypothetical protein [Tepidibacter sp.]
MNNIENLLQKILNAQNKTNERLDSLENQVLENTQILKALEHKVDIIKVDVENIRFDLAETKGDFKELKKDVTAVEVITSKNWNDIAHIKAIK